MNEQWMVQSWKTDPCYAEYGVDGGMCSIRYYLSEIENWCPPLPANSTFKPITHKASWNKNLTQLLSLINQSESKDNYAWIMDRIERSLWHLWSDAVVSFQRDKEFLLDNKMRSKRKILIYLGFLSKKSGFRIQQSATAGGPLGELVQWSDILSALFTMGHELIVTSEYEELVGLVLCVCVCVCVCVIFIFRSVFFLCFFTSSLYLLSFVFSASWFVCFCLLRIIDTFGTEAPYNSLTYSKKFKNLKTAWGGQELDLRQFYTMFPHSPDNSFMGFVVEQHLNTTESRSIERKQQALVYGKSLYMWSGMQDYLSVISKHVEIHATVFTNSNEAHLLPSFVHNHGILSGPDLHRLLSESKLFIGMGFPYEGPAPLEAIAAGCVFINPKFNPPHSSLNTKFFKGKPTARELTSQHPYTEHFISNPNVFTVDISNLKEVERVVKQALQLIDTNKVKPYLPFEFTHKGMLQRLNAYMEHQDFCTPHKNIWPPVRAVRLLVSESGQSCKDACWSRNMTCEPSHFRRINKPQTFEHLFSSSSSAARPYTGEAELHHPSVSEKLGTCYLQGDNLLFSCVSRTEGYLRVCPCRNFLRGQIALCPDCL
ncbi:hypothetical protein HELRODRAFT_115589 [Helobdella robusta]|uniref:alpha-1,6-mannosyl-glycoprotein 6-beta-N-acetylglucosaminyltransferase n=1 Tax=Helobdella robusta TaxID=6412 RepID=T1EG95_HELRO|nr:hypothetical protein HELRODRAFT_115589 [Helobdella robusta]ESN93534.1 hypothetical protein HELRODRAFT_115589 [Helobdella robusta]